MPSERALNVCDCGRPWAPDGSHPEDVALIVCPSCKGQRLVVVP